MNSQRAIFLDLAKGVGILLMLFQHCIPQHNLWRLFLQAFDMPLFFVVGGYIWSLKNARGVSVGLSSDYFIKRLKQLGLPYLVGCFVLALFYEMLSLTQGNHSIIDSFIRIITLKGIDSMWFLPVYFLSEILFLSVIGLKKQLLVYLYLLFVILVLHIIVLYEGAEWPFALVEKSLLGSLFFLGGYLYGNHKAWDSTVVKLLVLVLIGIIGSYINGFTSFANLHYPVLYFIDGLCLSVAVLMLSQHVEGQNSFISRVIVKFGRETLLVLCTNNLFIEIVRLLDYKLTNSFFLNHGMLGNFLMFIVITIIELIFILLYRSLFSLGRQV